MAQEEDQVQENQETENQEPQYSVEEQRAMQYGWTPKDKWDGPEDEWVSAKTFNDRATLFSRIAKDKKEITALQHTVRELVQHSKKTYDDGFQAGLKELRAQRKDAIESGDTEKVFEIEDQIDQFKEEHAQKRQEFEQRVAVGEQAAQQTNPIFEAWHVENQWYLQDAASSVYANELIAQMAEQARLSGTQVDYPKALQEITRKVKQKFPEKFGRVSTREPSRDNVDSGSGRTDSGRPKESAGSTKNMTDQERTIMRSIMKSTGMSQADYMKEYHKFTERKG